MTTTNKAPRARKPAAGSNGFTLDDIADAVWVFEAPAASWRTEAKELNGAAKENRLRAYAAFMHRVAVFGIKKWNRGRSQEFKAALLARGATASTAKALSEIGQGALETCKELQKVAIAGEAEILAFFKDKGIKTESAIKALWKAPRDPADVLAEAVAKLDDSGRTRFHAALKALDEAAALAAERADDAEALAESDEIVSE